ncbi:response regulator transcription factor [Anaerobacillus sp. CMMVII]|uniref:response regulator transcription factor n=1 Tax=Anaerobacillus sp. CMMVII TaxID=2755588 RepID=UPI0021B71C69|nr:response regulator transcription factor [Anaerobacillus sp. CMMVII]MCT8139305.1 response regulator transcription factor [Anaerobacillus sp. CMMVII]
MSYRILVVEDDVYIQELIKEFLQAQNYQVDVVDDGIKAWKLINHAEKNYDLVLLDIMLPNLDGFSLCKMIRQKSSVPVIILTALNEEKDQLKAFELEADDFLSKPFSFNVLVRRVEAVLRRVNSNSVHQNLLAFKRLKLELGSYKAYVDNQLIELTVKEFEILQMFLENIGIVLTRDVILEKVWGYDFFGDNRIVDAHIKNIRKKIGLPYIKTIKGLGYSLERERHEKRDHA